MARFRATAGPEGAAPPSESGGGRALTAWSLAALAAALFLGILGHLQGGDGFHVVARLVAPLGALWLDALQMTVIPVVVVHMLAAMVSGPPAVGMGRLGARALVLFIVLLVVAGLFAMAVGGGGGARGVLRSVRRGVRSARSGPAANAPLAVRFDPALASRPQVLERRPTGLTRIRRMLEPFRPVLAPVARAAFRLLGRVSRR